MAQRKGQHIFEVGDLVYPHPIIAFLYKDVEYAEFGIVLKKIPPSHPIKDYRKVIVFWQNAMKEETYYAHMLFHLHHEERLRNIWNQWAEAAKVLKDSNRQIGATHLQYLNQKGLIDAEKFPHYNPCQGIKG
jgi:hypothetical protein